MASGTYDSVAVPPALAKPARFASILAARKNDTHPSELEVNLRTHCQKLRVIETLAGGAHLLFPGEAGLAVRCYYPSDIQALEMAAASSNQNQPSMMDAILHGKHQDEDVDGLATFQSAFRTTVVFFVLPHDELTKQQDNPNSFLRRACRILHSSCQSSEKGKASLVLPVHDTAAAIGALLDICDANGAAKRGLRREFGVRQRLHMFLPDAPTDLQNPRADGYAVIVAASSFREWADRFVLPEGEADVLMSVAGTLENVIGGSNGRVTCAPVESATFETLQMFFEMPVAGQAPTAEMPVAAPPTAPPPMPPAQYGAYQQQASPPYQQQQHPGNGGPPMARSPPRGYQQSQQPAYGPPGPRAAYSPGPAPVAFQQAPATGRRMMHRYM